MLLPIGTSAEANLFSSKPDCSTKEYSTKELTRRSKPGVVMIATNKATGSGFVVRHIKNQTLILTNSHVLKGSNQITVEWLNGDQDSAVIVLDGGATTTLTDLALLKVEGKEGKALPLKQGEAIVGGDVIAIGSPQGLSFTLTKGVISSLRDKGRIVQTDTAINPGSSGGPLINKSGCVVGVNTSRVEDEVGLNFAISSQTAQRFIDKYDPESNNNNQFKKPITNSEIECSVTNQFKSANCFFDYASRKYDSKDYSGAISDYTKVIQIKPNYAHAYQNRGLARYELKDYSGAISDYTKAIQINTNDVDAYQNRGLARYELKDYAGAKSDYSKAIDIHSRLLHAYSNQYYLKDKAGAVIDYAKTLEINSKYEIAYHNRGVVKHYFKDYSGAISDYTKAIEIKPEYFLAYNNRGLAHQKEGDLQSACADWRQASSLGYKDASKLLADKCLQKEI